jgi:hypothetical protein
MIKFEVLRSILVNEYIGRCQAMMFNKMQCYKGASYKTIDDSTNPPTETQYCTGCAKREQIRLAQLSLTEPTKEPIEDENGVLVDESATTDESRSDGTTA